MKHKIYLFFLSSSLYGCMSTAVDTEVQKIAEQAYFEGQRDYANGDIRITFTNDCCWVWTKSPWNSGQEPIYNPSIIHSRTAKDTITTN